MEKLSALNSEVGSFQKKLPGIVEKRLNKDNLWWHKKQIGQTYCYFDQRPPYYLDTAIREIIGKLSPILKKYKFLPRGSKHPRAWCESSFPTAVDKKKAWPFYPFALDWSENMKNRILEHEQMRVEAGKKRFRMEKVEQ